MNFHQNGLGLKETLEILSRNKFLIILCLLISSFLGFGYFHFGPKKYRIGTKLLIYQNSKNKSLAGDWMAELEDFDNSNFVSNEMEILKSMRFRNLVLNSVDKRSKITEYQFRENLSVIRIKNTDIIEITFISDEPEQGILLLEELLCFYRENSSEKIRSSEKKTLDFLNSRVVELKSQIESVENLLSNFKEESNVSLSVELFAIELEKKLSANKVFEKEFLVSKNELLSTKENLNYLFLSPQLYGNLSNWYNEKKLELSRFRNITSEGFVIYLLWLSIVVIYIMIYIKIFM